MSRFYLPLSPSVKRTTFKGTPEYNLCVLNYLKKKYDSDAHVIVPSIRKKSGINHRDVSIRWVQLTDRQGYFSVPPDFWVKFKKNKNKRFVIFPFGFDCKNTYGHANYMVYDRDEYSLERFEPYGQAYRKCLNPVNLDTKMKELFRENLGYDSIKRYYKPLDFLEIESIQRLQEKETKQGGFCPVWSCFYVEIRLSNPELSRNRVIKDAIKNIKKRNLTLTQYIVNYSSYLTKECKRCK